MKSLEYGQFFQKYGQHLAVKIKMTKQIYKAMDSYDRYQRWIGKELCKAIREKYGMAETKKI